MWLWSAVDGGGAAAAIPAASGLAGHCVSGRLGCPSLQQPPHSSPSIPNIRCTTVIKEKNIPIDKKNYSNLKLNPSNSAFSKQIPIIEKTAEGMQHIAILVMHVLQHITILYW